MNLDFLYLVPITCPYCHGQLLPALNMYNDSIEFWCAKLDKQHFFRFTRFNDTTIDWHIAHRQTKININKNELWQETPFSHISLIKIDPEINYHQAADHLKRYLKLKAFL